MGNLLRSTTATALFLLQQYVRPGDTAVDATCGNGNDTAALARMGAGSIYAFDIQKEAIERTRRHLEEEGLMRQGIHLIADSHEKIGDYIEEPIRAAVMNLGYLPSASREIVTRAETTTRAIRQLLRLLQKDGIICITMYSGHPGGGEEKRAVLRLAANLDKRKYHAAYLSFINQPDAPPELLLITAKQ